MCEKTARDHGKNHPKGLKGTIPRAHTRLGIVPIPHQPDKNKQTNKEKHLKIHNASGRAKQGFYFNSPVNIKPWN